MAVTINGNGAVTGLTALPDSAMAVGSVIQVVQTTKTTAFTTTSSSATDVTGLTASITPSSSSNKILVTVSLGNFNNQVADKPAAINIVRGSTNVLVGDNETGSECTAMTTPRATNGAGAHIQLPFSYSVLDSPSTTSATTYKLQVFTTDGGTVSINRPGTRDSASGNTASTLIVQEVVA